MPRGKTVSVVASDRAVRRSIEFSLKAEGFDVEPHSSLASVGTAPEGTSCLVVDDDVLRDGTATDLLKKLQAPVVLLVDPLRPVSAAHATRVLTKPYLGIELIESVVEVAGLSGTVSDRYVVSRRT